MKYTYIHTAPSEGDFSAVVTRPAITMREELQMYENGDGTEDISSRNDNYQCQAGDDIPAEAFGLTFISQCEYGCPNSALPIYFAQVSERLGLDSDFNPVETDSVGSA